MTLPKAFWLLWCGQTVSRLGILAPAFLILFLQQDHLADPRTTPVMVGLFGAGILASGLAGGAVADLIGPRRTIIAAQPLAAATALLFLVSTNVYVLGLLCLATGFLSAVDRPAGAGLIATIVPAEQFSKAYSLFLVGFNVGMSLSPVISGFLLAFYPPALFLVWAAGSMLYALLVWALPADEARPEQQDGNTASALRRAARGITEPYRSPVLVAYLALVFLLACVYLQVNSALPLDMRRSGLSPGDIGIVLAINAVLSIALLPLVPRAVKKMGDETPLVLAATLMAVGFGLNALAHDIVLFTAATVVWTLGEVLWAPMSATFIAVRAPEGRVSTYQGSYFFAWNAAFVIGGPIGITVANAYGYPSLWICLLLLGLVAAAGFKSLPRLTGFTTTSTSASAATAAQTPAPAEAHESPATPAAHAATTAAPGTTSRPQPHHTHPTQPREST
ncbi:MFS transporter [Streptomyces sp. NPDC059618]|uniref:MFS transporter n=1 Tax=Streptomyces sp. NPDC059618 TaxID=3346887 RepID=UPI0036CD5262